MINFNQAKRLKELGFPQPEKEVGQLWYSDKGGQVFVGKKWNTLVLIDFDDVSFSITSTPVDLQIKPVIYAPTVEEIMSHIDGYKRISQWINGKWCCRFYDAHQKMHETKDYKNPFDALIEVWEKINTK